MHRAASDGTNPPRERHSKIVDDVQPDPKGLGGKLISSPARPTHGLYSHALVQALKSLSAQCEPFTIFFCPEGIPNTTVVEEHRA